MQFNDDVVGGVTLIRPAIQSPDYVAGTSGWSINADGSAEFNDIVIRGGNGTAAVIIGPSSGPQVVINSSGTAGYIQFPTNRAIENDISTILAGVLNAGAVNEGATLQISGPSVDGATDRCRIFLNSQNNDGTSQANMSLQAGSGSLVFDEEVMSLGTARFRMTPVATANPALSIEAAGGHTGALLQASVGGDTKFGVDASGVLTTYADNTFGTFTPTVTGGGTVTWSTQTGWYQKLGKGTFFTAYLQVNAAGSGATPITIAGPVTLDRTTRQTVGAHVESLTAGNNGSCRVVAFTGGSGAVFDRLRNSTNGSITGADLLAGGLITVTGWCREA